MVELPRYLDACVAQRGSDVHLAVGRRPMLRVHGHFVELDAPALTPDDVDAVARQILSPRHAEELHRTGTTDLGYAYRDGIRFRTSVFTERGRRGVVMRLIPNELLSFEQIGLPTGVRDLLTLHRGLVLVTGPTGSGKTTTLATMVDWVNRNRDVHIITVEDPIEFQHQHQRGRVTQREVGSDVPSFAEAMRRALRQDPDVVMLGEMRDLETTSAAITAAETGHLVLGTLHTTGAARTIDRIIDQYPHEQQEQIRSQLAGALVAVVSQILLPTADGQGRVAAFEIMISNGAIENHIRKSETFKVPSVIQTSRRQGMMLMDDAILELHRAGRITREVAVESAFDRKVLEARMGGGVT
ncbi:MAG: type IV pilus twitching motility protein PilT [Planctomycetes bacterium]|nr:type IV pilus twitching motility protein PilT [Planctomycetota bacterium]